MRVQHQRAHLESLWESSPAGGPALPTWACWFVMPCPSVVWPPFVQLLDLTAGIASACQQSILIEDAKQQKKKRLVVTSKMRWDTLWSVTFQIARRLCWLACLFMPFLWPGIAVLCRKKVNEKMRYKEVVKIVRKSDGVASLPSPPLLEHAAAHS